MIRPIQEKDSQAVKDIIKTVMTEIGASGEGFAIHDPEVDAIFSAYAGERCAFLVVESDGEVLGCGGIAPLQGGGAEVCELRKLYFLPELRGRGLGGALVRVLMDAARERGFERMYIETLDALRAANALYEKLGFAPIPGPLGDTGHFSCDRFMVRDL